MDAQPLQERAMSAAGGSSETAPLREALNLVFQRLGHEDASAVKLACKEWWGLCNAALPALKALRFRSCSGPFSARWQRPECPVVWLGERLTAAQCPSEDEEDVEEWEEWEEEGEDYVYGYDDEEEENEPSCHLAYSQTAAQAAASLASVLRARHSAQGAGSLELNFAVWASWGSWGNRYPPVSYDKRFVWADQESKAATLTLWRVVLEACPAADDITACLHDFEWASLVDALPELLSASGVPLRRLHLSVLRHMWDDSDYSWLDYALTADTISSTLRLPRLANLHALELSGTLFDFSLEDLLLAAPTALVSLQLSRVTFRVGDGMRLLPPNDPEAAFVGGWPCGTRTWARLARLERLRVLDARAINHLPTDEDVRFPAHISMLTALRHLEIDCLTGLYRQEDSARLPAGLKSLSLAKSRSYYDDASSPDLVRVAGPSPLERLKLRRFAGFGSWDVSGLELGALTSLELHSGAMAPQPLPAWLTRCAALRELRLHARGGFESGAQEPPDGGPAGALPRGALAGLASLELLEVGQMGYENLTRLAGREALRPFTARGSTARFPPAWQQA